MLYGGFSASSERLGDFWEWTGSQWNLIATDRAAGSAGKLEYDLPNHRMIHFSAEGGLWYRPRN